MALPSNVQVSLDGSPLPFFSPYPVAGSAGVNLLLSTPLYCRPSFLIFMLFPLFPVSLRYTVTFGSPQFSSIRFVCLILLPVSFGGVALARKQQLLSFSLRGAHLGSFSPYSGGFFLRMASPLGPVGISFFVFLILITVLFVHLSLFLPKFWLLLRYCSLLIK